jgi:uncharacterized protein (TIGR00369 family)
MSGGGEADDKMTADKVEAILRRGPYHQWLDLRVLGIEPDAIDIKATWREEWVVNAERGYTHGGILATLVDLAADWALVSRTGRGVPTIDLRVDYHRAAMPGDLLAKGRVIKFGSQVSVCEAQISNVEGTLLASGRGVYLTAAPKA